MDRRRRLKPDLQTSRYKGWHRAVRHYLLLSATRTFSIFLTCLYGRFRSRRESRAVSAVSRPGVRICFRMAASFSLNSPEEQMLKEQTAERTCSYADKDGLNARKLVSLFPANL